MDNDNDGSLSALKIWFTASIVSVLMVMGPSKASVLAGQGGGEVPRLVHIQETGMQIPPLQPVTTSIEAKATPAEVVYEIVTKPPVVKATQSGDRYDLLRQAGIAEVELAYADSIFKRESNWDYKAWSKVDVKSYGLGQANLLVQEVPPGFMDDPIIQIQWFDQYAKSRYGGWAEAAKFWENNNWW